MIFLVGCAAAAAAGACAADNITAEADRGTGYFLPSTFLSFNVRCFRRLLLLLFLPASIAVV